MGYYKNQSISSRRGATKGSSANDSTMTANTKAIEKKFAKLLKAVGSEEKQLKIHRKVARVAKKALRGEITDYHRTAYVRRTGRDGGKKGPPIDIPKGTLKRSVKSWRIKGYKADGNKETSYWVGPKAGGRVNQDGWFAGIVESGLQYFGEGPNKGAFKRGKAKANSKAVRLLENEYIAVIKKAAR